MATADEDRPTRRTFADLRGDEVAAILLTVLTLVLLVLYAVFTAFYLSKPAPGCDEAGGWTDGPLRMLTILGPIAAVGAIATAIWAAVRSPHVVGLVAVVVNLGVVFAGCALLLVSLRHTGFEICMIG